MKFDLLQKLQSWALVFPKISNFDIEVCWSPLCPPYYSSWLINYGLKSIELFFQRGENLLASIQNQLCMKFPWYNHLDNRWRSNFFKGKTFQKNWCCYSVQIDNRQRKIWESMYFRFKGLRPISEKVPFVMEPGDLQWNLNKGPLKRPNPWP